MRTPSSAPVSVGCPTAAAQLHFRLARLAKLGHPLLVGVGAAKVAAIKGVQVVVVPLSTQTDDMADLVSAKCVCAVSVASRKLQKKSTVQDHGVELSRVNQSRNVGRVKRHRTSLRVPKSARAGLAATVGGSCRAQCAAGTVDWLYRGRDRDLARHTARLLTPAQQRFPRFLLPSRSDKPQLQRRAKRTASSNAAFCSAGGSVPSYSTTMSKGVVTTRLW